MHAQNGVGTDGGRIVPDVYNVAVPDAVNKFFVFGQLQSMQAVANTSRGYLGENRNRFFAIYTARLTSFPSFWLNINLQSCLAQEGDTGRSRLFQGGMGKYVEQYGIEQPPVIPLEPARTLAITSLSLVFGPWKFKDD